MGPAGPGVAVMAVFAAFSSSLLAQVEEKRFLEEERRRAMDERERPPEEDLSQPFLWDAGGWLHLAFLQLDDHPFRSSRTARFGDLRLWGEARIAGRLTAYLRLQSYYLDFNEGDQFAGRDDDIYRIARVDQAWGEVDLSSETNDLRVRVGRQFLSLGRGLLFNNVAYAAAGQYAAGRFGLRGFVAHSILSEDDIDRSRPNARDSRRGFAGLEARMRVVGFHEAYLLALAQRDFKDDRTATQAWDYDSNYVGIGARGPLAGPVGYSAEAVYEFGRSAAAGTRDREDIRAWALLARLDAAIEGPLAPYLVAEYMFGSGDPDRGSVTDAALGNQPGTDDEGFLAFGFVQTGFSLFPRVSNIHIFKLGGTLRPLGNLETFKLLEVGLFGYAYRKHEKASPISDPRSFLPDADVGREVDVLLRWRIASDVSFSVSWGRFFPGDAYLEDRKRDFLYAALTYSF